MKTIFIFAYYSFKDPIFQSAVLPYFKGLGQDKRLRFVILTFEQQKYKQSLKEVAKVKKELALENIILYRTNWHSGSFKLLKKVFDFCWGFSFASYLIFKYKVKAIYSEGFPGAIISYFLSKIFQKPHLVHSYEPHTDYMVEAGVWKKNSWEAKLLRKFEVMVGHSASYIFTATEAMIARMREQNMKSQAFRVPSCVDTSFFYFSQKHRREIREKLGIKEEDLLLTYLGKFGGMYMDEEIFEFFDVCESQLNYCFKYLIITPENHNEIREKFLSVGLPIEKLIIRTLQREEISPYLSASDFGLVPVRQKPAKRYCSPIKDGEYWACGLPIIIPKGISDDYIFAEEHRIGIVWEDTSTKSIAATVKEMIHWRTNEAKKLISERCVAFVQKDRSIDQYKQIYREIFLKI